jgi:hypothetical protein
MRASLSESEEFFAVTPDDKRYPVFICIHSAGLDKWADSLETFITEVR